VKDARQKLADSAPLPPECLKGVLPHLARSSEASAVTCKSLMELFEVLRGTADENDRRLNLIALIDNQTQRLIAQKPTRIIAGDEDSKQEGVK